MSLMVRGLAGAVIGGAIGYFAFIWIAEQGFYALILPGALLGAGFGKLSGQASRAGGTVCGVLGIALGIFAEWRFGVLFVREVSLWFFVAHLHELEPITLIMIAAGGYLAYYCGRSRIRMAAPRKAPPR